MKKELFFGLGRMNRIRFLAYSNLVIIFAILFAFFIPFIMPKSFENFIVIAISLIAGSMLIKFTIQRYHDVGASGWWSIWSLTPGYPIIFLLLGTVAGMSSSNKYGEPNPENNIFNKLLAIIPVIIFVIILIWWNFYL